MSGGRFVRCLAHDGAMRVLAVMAPQAAQEVSERHSLGAASAALAAQGMVASLLLSAHIKGDERILLEIAGLKPTFAFSGEANSDGSVRARFSPPDLEPSTSLQGRLVAIKWDSLKEVYRGVAEVNHDSLEGALQEYMVQSQQTRGRVRIGVVLGEDGQFSMAAGLLVELIPGRMEPEQFEALVEPLQEADLAEVMTAFAFGTLLGSNVEVLEAREVRFQCSCTMERVEATLRALGAVELREMAAEDQGAEVTCHFCGSTYNVEKLRLLSLASEMEG